MEAAVQDAEGGVVVAGDDDEILVRADGGGRPGENAMLGNFWRHYEPLVRLDRLPHHGTGPLKQPPTGIRPRFTLADTGRLHQLGEAGKRPSKERNARLIFIQSKAAEGAVALQLALAKLVTPPALFSTSVERIDDTDLVVVDVPAGPDRPYVARGGVWLRKGARTAPADAQSLRAMFSARAEQPERWERRLSASMVPEDLKQSEILELRDEGRRAGRFDFSGDETAEAVLDRLAMTRPGGFTQAADVLFSINPALRHPQVRVQFSIFRSDEVGDEFDDLRSFEGPLLRIADDVTDVLTHSNAIRSSFRRDEMERRDAPRYARYALREGVVNALVHRDYASYSGGVKVSVYPSRVEIWNTGRLPDGLKPEDLPRSHPSILVNPDIAHAFFLRNRMDKIGRGGQRLAEECKLIGARAPEWAQVHGGVRLTLFAALGKDHAQRELLNDRQRAFVEGVAAGERLALADYQARFAPNVSGRQARRDLNELETYRFVRREGIGRRTSYRRLGD